MSKNNIIIIAIVVLVVVAALWVNKANGNDVYSVVYMTTGEVYVGKLTTFPDFQLKDGYILQVAKDETDPTKNNFQLNSVKDVLWAPKSMYLIKDNIVFYGPLLVTSKIAETIAAQGK